MTYIALLRAVNLGAHQKVGMADLREIAARLGFSDARTILQSGNLIFEGASLPQAQVEAALHEAAKKRLGLDTDIFVRTAKEWKAVVTANPFPKEAKTDPGHLVVMALRDVPRSEDVAALEKAIPGRERLRAKGRHLYIVYPDGIGHSRLTTALIERKLGTRGTGRNWNTVLKLVALAGPHS